MKNLLKKSIFFILVLSVNTFTCFSNSYSELLRDSVSKYNKKHKKTTYKPKTSEEIFNEVYNSRDSLTPNYEVNGYRKSNNEAYNSSPEDKVNSTTYSEDDNSIMGRLAKEQLSDFNNEKDESYLIYILVGLFIVIIFGYFGLKDKSSAINDSGNTETVTKITPKNTLQEKINHGNKEESPNILLKIIMGIVLLYVIVNVSKWLGCQRHHGDDDSTYTRGFR